MPTEKNKYIVRSSIKIPKGTMIRSSDTNKMETVKPHMQPAERYWEKTGRKRAISDPGPMSKMPTGPMSPNIPKEALDDMRRQYYRKHPVTHT